ncbi:uncharacterized protein ARMOST_21448 [Armillaria ostoyae]|nr:uncharacterized protein ARMOST_21448 [Armillaria ostoyae]
MADSIAYAFRIISIVESHAAVESVKQERKRDLKKAADVEMADSSRPGPSIQSMVDRAVAAKLKTVEAKKGKKKDTKKKASTSTQVARRPPKATKGAEQKKGKPKPKTKPKTTAKPDKGKGKAKGK